MSLDGTDCAPSHSAARLHPHLFTGTSFSTRMCSLVHATNASCCLPLTGMAFSYHGFIKANASADKSPDVFTHDDTANTHHPAIHDAGNSLTLLSMY
jgi:hypothetical protein